MNTISRTSENAQISLGRDLTRSLTYAGVVEAFKGITAEPITAENRAELVARYERTLDDANGFNWGPVWNKAMTQAAVAAYAHLINRPAALYSLVSSLERMLSAGPTVSAEVPRPDLQVEGKSRPIPAKTIEWTDEPATGQGVNWQNATLTSASAMLIYEPDAVFLAAMRQQGFMTPVGDNRVLEDSFSGARAFVGARKDTTLVTFCGTEDKLNDLFTDADFRLVERDYYANVPVQVHAGFDAQLSALWPQLKEQILQAAEQNPGKPVIFTGHSLGGALAQLAMARAKHEGLIDEIGAVMHTFGQPRVSTQQGIAAMDACTADVARRRFVFGDDPVAIVPVATPGLFPYEHGSAQEVSLGSDTPHVDRNNLIAAAQALRNHLEHHNEVNYYAACLDRF